MTKVRQTGDSGVYHVSSRGNNKQQIFEEDSDCRKLIQIIGEEKEEIHFSLHALGIMGDHIHMIIQIPPPPSGYSISDIMRRILSKFVQYYNRKYEREGHLFQGRFFSKPIEDVVYYKTAFRYIHQNPINAGLERKIGEYLWSSYGIYKALQKYDTNTWRFLADWSPNGKCIIDTQLSIQVFGNVDNLIEFSDYLISKDHTNNRNTIKSDSYRTGANNTNSQQIAALPFRLSYPDSCDNNACEESTIPLSMSDAEAKRIIYMITACSNISEFQNLSTKEKEAYIPRLITAHISKEKMQRLCGVSVRTYNRFLKRVQTNM